MGVCDLVGQEETPRNVSTGRVVGIREDSWCSHPRERGQSEGNLVIEHPRLGKLSSAPST